VERTGLGRLLGLRRGGGAPPATRAGQPLHPLTLPNLVGFARIVLIAVFLAIALGSRDGRVTLATVCWAVAAASDYLDGLLARVTGQYSRLGALMDPSVDRTLILSAVIVDWKFELLPRWALAVLAARELVMIVLVLAALRSGLDIEINWIGRLAIWPTMMGVGGALMTDWWAVEAFLYVGIAGSVLASLLYVRAGVRELRARER
jgi:CDP-diacylglycerol--glycerol-3-phosphate 3-phosphatidyltransferase